MSFLRICMAFMAGLFALLSVQTAVAQTSQPAITTISSTVTPVYLDSRAAERFNLLDHGGVVTYSPPAPKAGASAGVELAQEKARPKKVAARAKFNVVVEVGTPVNIIEAPRRNYQPKSGKVDFVRVAVEYTPPGSLIFPYVAVGSWDNTNREATWFYGGTAKPIPLRTTFAVVGLGIRSEKRPVAGSIVFQANGGFGRTWNRDQIRTSAKHIFEGQVSVSYQVTSRLAIRTSYVHYSTGEGSFLRPKSYRNGGEGRATLGVSWRL